MITMGLRYMHSGEERAATTSESMQQKVSSKNEPHLQQLEAKRDAAGVAGRSKVRLK